MTASPLTSASRAPTNRDENWKYANLRALSKISFDAAVDDRTTVPIAADLPASTTACRLVLIDGQYSASLSDALPSGTVI